MVEYKCKKCKKIFTHLGNYNSHIMRLFPCKESEEINIEIPKETINEGNELVCRYCNKVFSRKDVCLRHERSNC